MLIKPRIATRRFEASCVPTKQPMMLSVFFMGWLQIASQSLAFSPVPRQPTHLTPNVDFFIKQSPPTFARSLNHHNQWSLLFANTEDAADQTSSGSKEFSYSAIVKAMDASHNKAVAESCPYLPVETIISPDTHRESMPEKSTDSSRELFQSLDTPVLPAEASKSLRLAAKTLFESRRDKNSGAPGQEVVNLAELLSLSSSSPEEEWKKYLDSALMQQIYPLVRSAWSDHDAFTNLQPTPALVVTSATVIAEGGYPGAKVALTTLERDAGLFAVHIDLGNDGSANKEHDVMGAIYLESLVGGDDVTESVVGPLSPGQVVVHRSMERSAAIIVPSNLKELGKDDLEKGRQSLDSSSRRQILKAAESARHYALRLVLTVQGVVVKAQDDNADADITNDPSIESIVPEAPSEERAYRLRNFAMNRVDRVRYLTLAGLLDADDHESHLLLGFDYISRMDNPDYSADGQQRLSDINRGVFHLEKAAALCPSDARIQFQLATALGAKIDCEKSLYSEENVIENDFSDAESVQLAPVVAALERSALLESAAVKLGINGVQDLSICWHALAETRCKMGEFDKALDVIDRWAECGSLRSSLAIEDMQNQANDDSIPSYEWLRTSDTHRNVAVRTLGDVPLFTAEDISMLRAAADRRFSLANGAPTSRYTMQYEGNSEVHLDDLCAADPILKARMDQILQTKVYPLVRSAFSNEIGADGDNATPIGPICVYDSIFVRYNGDQARASGRDGASQPLHQDGGIYSVNIALNAHKEDGSENGFTGGGTFFEAFTDDDHYSSIQRPTSTGHAILHHTTARHAGAPTTSGIRDILVIFLTARQPEEADNVENTWRIERAMRLQSIAKELRSRSQLISCLEIARENDPTNSEMSYWLGVHLLQGSMADPSDERWEEICRGVEIFKSATLLNPADARAHYHHGMAIAARHKYAMRTRKAHLLPPPDEVAASMIDTFETAIRLERKCGDAGCKNGINLAAGYLNLADFMARLKNFDKAIDYLNEVPNSINEAGDSEESWAISMLQEASSMMEYCKNESAKLRESAVA